MNRTQTFLAAINLALVVGIAFQWLNADLRWAPPQAIAPEESSLRAEFAHFDRMDPVVLAETLARPVFWETRRPPPLEEKVEAPPVVAPDPLNGVTLLGMFGAGKDMRVMVRADNKVTRLARGERFGPWTVQGLNDREVIFRDGDSERRLELKRAPQPAGARLPVPLSRLGLGGARADDAKPADAEGGDEKPGEPQATPPAQSSGGAPAAPAVQPQSASTPQPAAAASGAQRPRGTLAERIAARRAQRNQNK